MAKPELKPCPFCGHPASEPVKKSNTGRTIWQIGCVFYCITMKRTTKKEVVNDWNKRRGC